MENEEKNQTEQSDKSRSVWRELWDFKIHYLKSGCYFN